MRERGFNKLFWGFFFIMLSFRIQGFDVLPDIVGYVFFALGFADLASSSQYFKEASKYNIPMLMLSLFAIYEKPAQAGGVTFGQFGVLSFIIGIASIILNLLVIYNLFMGIKEIALEEEHTELANEADERWNQYKILQIAMVFSIALMFIPLLTLIYVIVLFIASILLTIKILSFINKCKMGLSPKEGL